ncbi:IS982 family transposase [Lactobacillus helveticus]|uniref:IS982 family transposase n=1 Tax=Lactobacillus helveticus TaxID=1587 RepID=UPI001C647617|nr:IS982 family transposase [Lactobacillus helveticus]
MNCLKLKRFSQRRNINQVKATDSLILALLIWQVKTGIESQRRFCECFGCLSHSRFNRRSRQLLQLIYQIRQKMNQKVDLSGQFLIIDSFPVPVCQPVHNYRVRIFRGSANIGYKATKKIYYYGFKVHAIVSDDGYVLDYAVTHASVHDAKETVELMKNTHPANRYLLGDEGYLGKRLHDQLKQTGYEMWTPYRKNMAGAKKHDDRQLMAIHRTIESDFSLLTSYNAENNRARSLTGFQARLEIAILTYNLAYCLERFN